MDISIGKFTLESLTTGMYSEPESCYREYIQNAVDSLDSAIELGLISLEECRIEIIVDSQNNMISVKDNGTGIPSSNAAKTLLDIGNSTKLHTTNRGFRGIGRLGGLSYCKKLSFCTTSRGESNKTIITFDCDKLKDLLVPGQNTDKDLKDVINAVTEVSILPEQSSLHYFIVKMDGVDDIASLLDIDIVRDYITQIAPLPFRERFFWGNQIKDELRAKGVKIAEYPVFLGSSFEDLVQIFKPYKLTLNVSARSDVTKDEIYGLSFFDVKDKNDVPIASGWYADTGFLGTLADERISGIRVRQGNIQIGSSKTLAQYFKESRFNGWALGELYIISDSLIPNARRDDFEKNDTFSSFEDGVRSTIGSDISDKIRSASKARNNPSQKTITKAEKTIAKVEEILATGFNSSFEKEQLTSEIATAKKEIHSIPKASTPEILERKSEIIEKLSELSSNVEESSNYKAKKDVTSDFSKAEKKIIQAILEVLSKNFERSIVDSLYQEMLIELKTKGKK